MYQLKFTKKTIQKVWEACQKYIKNDKDLKNVKSNLGLTRGEFLNVYQAADTGDEVRNLDEWYHELHHAVGVNKQYLKNFTKNKLKKTTILLLAYHHNIITFVK